MSAPEIVRRIDFILEAGKRLNTPYREAFEKLLGEIHAAGWIFVREGLWFPRRPKRDITEAACALAREFGKNAERIERELRFLLRWKYRWKFIEEI